MQKWIFVLQIWLLLCMTVEVTRS